tara:strand:+ start:1197 stop:1799 length:603 start_codon:yes stop_codon:yes gene_type:complete
MARYKMNGSELYGKMKLDRNMDNTSTPEGRGKSSMAQMYKKPGAPDMKTGKYAHKFEKGGAPKDKKGVINNENTEKYDKQQNIANPDGGTWRDSGRPKTYKSLQDDGTYKVMTNPSGKSSLTAEELKNTHKTKDEIKANNRAVQEQKNEEVRSKRERKQNKKAKIKNVKKKVVSAIKDPLGVKYRRKKKQQKAYDEAMNN